MRNRRWDRASLQNTSYPRPPLMRPNAYDSKLRIDQINQVVYMGPVVPRQPPGQVPYDNVNIIWEGGVPTQAVIAIDDFSVDHTNDAAWWADTSNFSHVVDGKQDFSSASGYAIFKKAPKAVEQTVVVKFVLVDAAPVGVSGVVPAFSVQGSWSGLFSLGMFWQSSGGPFWVQGLIATDTQQSIVSDLFTLALNTTYWMRVGSTLSDSLIRCEIFNHDPAQPGPEPMFMFQKTLVDVPRLAVPANTGLHMIGSGVLLDEYRVELFGSDQSGTVKDFDFKTAISHKYDGPRKWRDITIEWCMGSERLAFTTYPVFL